MSLSDTSLEPEQHALNAAGMQRVWLVSELYYPELTSTGYFVTGIAEGLAQNHSVSVLCSQPTYWARGVRAPKREMLNGVDVRRCLGATLNKNKLHFKLINLVTLSASIAWSALLRVRRNDIVIAVTNPPTLPYLMALVCRIKGARFVLLAHDVYPEVLARLDILKPQSGIYRFMDAASRWLYRSAERILVLGRDMREIIARKIEDRRSSISIAPNWGDTEANHPQPRASNRLLAQLDLTGKFVAQYCGNIGRTHGIEDIVGAAEIMRDESGIHFLMIGWGAKKDWAQQQRAARGLSNLTILDPLPREQFCDGLNACDIAVISFSKGMAGVSVPSRMYNVLAAGKPILAVCDEDSELAAVVNEEDVGWVVPPGRPDLIFSVLREAQANTDRLRAMGARARAAAEAKYTQTHVVEIYESLLSQMSAQ